MSDERVLILTMLKEGKITVEEAEALLDALGEERASAPDDAGREPSPGGEDRPREREGGAEAWWTPGQDIGDAVRAAISSVRTGVEPRLREVLKSLTKEVRAAGSAGSVSDVVQDLFGLASASEDVTLTHGAPEGGRLLVRNPRGTVRIGPSRDTDVRVRAHKTVWAKDESAARDLLAELRVTLAAVGSDLALEVGHDRVEPWVRRFRVDLDVEAPEQISASVDVKSGDLQAHDLLGELEVEIKNGDLDVQARPRGLRGRVLSGNVRLREAQSCELQVMSGDVAVGEVGGSADFNVAKGDVAVGPVRGDLTVRLAHGDLTAGDVSGTAGVEVSHGDVVLGACAGDVEARVKRGDLSLAVRGSRRVRAEVMSGDLSARVDSLAPEANLDLKVMSGDTTVELDPAVRGSISVEARSGDIECAIPLRDLRRSRGRLEGVAGTADARITVRTMSGEVSIRQA
jgi:DUF4097 and DUF4098 domain-containing protein YvlB